MTAPLPDAAFHRRRLAAIQQCLGAEGALDGLLLLDAHNLHYATGFAPLPSERPVGLYIPTDGAAVLFAPLLERENAAEHWPGALRCYFEYPGEEPALDFMLRESGGKNVGIDTLPREALDAWRAGRVRLCDLVARMRQVKQPEELNAIRAAARYADFCLEQLREHGPALIRAGACELDLLRHCLETTRARLKREQGETFRLRGSAVVGTLHSGPRAALPHGAPGERQPQPGDTLIAGIGVSVRGYHAESGATFLVAEAGAEALRCLRAAEACDAAARAALNVGARCAAVNEAALNVLREAGLGAAIRHRIGHGMGLQAHESPWLAPGDDTLLRPHMVFSCEPGIYRPGRDGYRCINSLILLATGVEVPSRFLADNPPDSRVLPL